jgi:APA family basic amino acid/polyamine antiporter
LTLRKVSFIAEEVREPGRTVPRALIGGSVLIIALYLFVNAGYALRPEAVANVPEAFSVAALLMIRMLGAGGASLLTVGMMFSTFGALHSLSLSVSRVPFAMARDGLLPPAFATVSARARVPTSQHRFCWQSPYMRHSNGNPRRRRPHAVEP